MNETSDEDSDSSDQDEDNVPVPQYAIVSSDVEQEN